MLLPGSKPPFPRPSLTTPLSPSFTLAPEVPVPSCTSRAVPGTMHQVLLGAFPLSGSLNFLPLVNAGYSALHLLHFWEWDPHRIKPMTNQVQRGFLDGCCVPARWSSTSTSWLTVARVGNSRHHTGAGAEQHLVPLWCALFGLGSGQLVG